MAGQSTAVLDLLFDKCDGVLVKEAFQDIETLDFVSIETMLPNSVQTNFFKLTYMTLIFMLINLLSIEIMTDY